MKANALMELQNEKKRTYLVEKSKELKLEKERLVEQLNHIQKEIDHLLIEIDFITNFDSFIDDESLKTKLGFSDLIDKKNALVISYDMKLKEQQYNEQKKVI